MQDVGRCFGSGGQRPSHFGTTLPTSSIKLIGGCQPVSGGAVSPSLAGCGSKEGMEDSVTAAGGGCRWWEVPRSATTTDSKPWRRVAGATLGQEDDLVALKWLHSSLFVLSVRIYSIVGVAPNSCAAPSGASPDAAAAKALFSGCSSSAVDLIAFAVFLWALTVKSSDWVVICFSSESLFLNVHPPPSECRFEVLRDLSLLKKKREKV